MTEAQVVQPPAVSPFDDLDSLAEAADLLAYPELSTSLEVGLDIMERAVLGNPTPRAPLWHIFEDEPTEAYRAFVTWLRQPPPRTFAAVSRELPHSSGRISQWSAEFYWEERAKAWSIHEQETYEEAYSTLVRRAAKAHAEQATNVLTAMLAPTNALLRRIDKEPEKFLAELDNMRTDQLLRLVVQAAAQIPKIQNAQRLALGLPTSITVTEEHATYDEHPDGAQIAAVIRELGLAGAFDERLGITRAPESTDTEDESVLAEEER